MSRDSIVVRHWLPATDCCQHYLRAVIQPVSDFAENLVVGFLHRVYRPGNDFELIPTVKMETIHPIEGYFCSKFEAICNHFGVMGA